MEDFWTGGTIIYVIFGHSMTGVVAESLLSGEICKPATISQAIKLTSVNHEDLLGFFEVSEKQFNVFSTNQLHPWSCQMRVQNCPKRCEKILRDIPWIDDEPTAKESVITV
jgi:hypothetical protein